MSDVTAHVIEDPGAGRRLAAPARTELAHDIRGWRRHTPSAVLIEVRGDGWHHAPEVDAAGRLDRSAVDAGYQSLASALFELSCPVVVSLEGRVSGFGLALAMAADVRVGTTGTTLAAGDGRPLAALLGGAGWLTARVAGTGTFAQLAWTSTAFPADEALRRGLLTAVTDEPGAARALTERIAAEPAGSSALKRALAARQRAEFSAVLGYEAWLADVASDGASGGAA